MIKFPVTPAKEKELLDRMKALNIFEKDIKEVFLLGSGKGGQKRNKTSTAVRLTHIPTGIEVRTDKTRSQAMNRFFARRMLCEKVENRG